MGLEKQQTLQFLTLGVLLFQNKASNLGTSLRHPVDALGNSTYLIVVSTISNKHSIKLDGSCLTYWKSLSIFNTAAHHCTNCQKERFCFFLQTALFTANFEDQSLSYLISFHITLFSLLPSYFISSCLILPPPTSSFFSFSLIVPHFSLLSMHMPHFLFSCLISLPHVSSFLPTPPLPTSFCLIFRLSTSFSLFSFLLPHSASFYLLLPHFISSHLPLPLYILPHFASCPLFLPPNFCIFCLMDL